MYSFLPHSRLMSWVYSVKSMLLSWSGATPGSCMCRYFCSKQAEGLADTRYQQL